MIDAESFTFKITKIDNGAVTIEVQGDFDAGPSFNKELKLTVGQKFNVSQLLSVSDIY